jgi:V/A-type H+-transporting ATPase subunit D
MPKVRLTKNELKTQRDALQRFQRYLPTLQLKKQQLQLEVRRRQDELAEIRRQVQAFRDRLAAWVRLWGDEDAAGTVDELLRVAAWSTGIRNVAGIETPTFIELRFEETTWDLFATLVWIDDAIDAAREFAGILLHQRILEEQLERIRQELRITTQRVNLFEKVKIPETQEAIRRIRIYLGDQQTAAVGRAKIAKRKTEVRHGQTAALSEA